MALTCQQIGAQVLAICKAPGFASQFDSAMISVLDEMCETYDWEATKTSFFGSLNPGQVPTNPNYVAGQGPYNLPVNYLRMEPRTFLYWYTSGISYPLINFDDADYDLQIQQVGVASLPRNYITDLSDPGQPVFYVYPPTNGGYPYQGRCYIRMPDVGSGQTAANGWVAGSLAPHLSSVIPWFPNTTYLITRCAAEVMAVTGDQRVTTFDGRAKDQLRSILQMANDRNSRSQRITFDKRRFGPRYSSLPDTKNIWG